MRSLRAVILSPMSTAALVVWLLILGICVVSQALLAIASRRDLAAIAFAFSLLCIAVWWTCLALYLGKLQRQREYPRWRRRLAQIGFAMSGFGFEFELFLQNAPFKPMQNAGIVQGIVSGCAFALLWFSYC